MSVERLSDGNWKIKASAWPNLRMQFPIPSKKWFEARELLIKHGFDASKPTSKKEAEIIERNIELAMQKDHAKLSSLKLSTFGQCLEHYKRTPKRNGEERRMVGAGANYLRLMDELGCYPVHEVYGRLNSLVEKMKKEKRKFKDGTIQNYTPATINRNITLAKAAISCAYNTRDGADWQRLIPENYLSGFPTLREDNISYRVLSDEERLRFWNALPEYMRPWYYFSLCVPVRVSETINIKISEQVNRFSGFISLEKTKNGLGREIKIPEGLKQYCYDIDRNFLFHKPDGSPLGRWSNTRNRYEFNCIRQWDRACKEAKIEGYNIHKTRQEACMILYQEGWSYEDIKTIGGWESSEAFDRYFNRQLALQIKNGQHKIDLTWKEGFASEIDSKVA